MRNYGQLEDFIDYSSESTWRDYVENQVVPLWESSWLIKETFERFQDEFDDRDLSTLSQNEQELFLGGIDSRRDAVYRRNSLAKFNKVFYGAQVSDLQSWVLSDSEEVPTEVNIEVSKTSFIELAENLYETLTKALSSQYLYQDYFEPEVRLGEVKEPERLQEQVEQFYKDVLVFCVNHSYFTFFLQSLNQVPRHFLEKAYPDFDTAQEIMYEDEFGLTTLDWNYPIKPDASIYESYQILCYPEYNPENKGASFGGSITKANDIIWNFFDEYSHKEFREDLSDYFPVRNLKKAYRDRVENRVTKVPDDWVKSGFNIYFKGLSASDNSGSSVENSTESLMELLDQAAPLLFLGLVEISTVGDNRLNFSKR